MGGKPLAYAPICGQKYQLFYRPANFSVFNRTFSHLDYGSSDEDLRQKLEKYNRELGIDYTIKVVTLPRRYWA